MEVNKRAEVPIRLSSSGEEGVTTLKERIPDTVWVTSASGRNWYQIERFRYENSLIKETINRARLSTLLEMYPLSVETLSFHWDSILNLKQYPIHGESRYIYTDFELQNDTIFSSSD